MKNFFDVDVLKYSQSMCVLTKRSKVLQRLSTQSPWKRKIVKPIRRPDVLAGALSQVSTLRGSVSRIAKLQIQSEGASLLRTARDATSGPAIAEARIDVSLSLSLAHFLPGAR